MLRVDLPSAPRWLGDRRVLISYEELNRLAVHRGKLFSLYKIDTALSRFAF
jgi:hypothetical protein